MTLATAYRRLRQPHHRIHGQYQHGASVFVSPARYAIRNARILERWRALGGIVRLRIEADQIVDYVDDFDCCTSGGFVRPLGAPQPDERWESCGYEATGECSAGRYGHHVRHHCRHKCEAIALAERDGVWVIFAEVFDAYGAREWEVVEAVGGFVGYPEEVDMLDLMQSAIEAAR
jgi:hypothetical protein